MARVDGKAPKELLVEIKDPASGQLWGQLTLRSKHFATGSQGFYATGKMTNLENPEARYQCNLQMVLIGSKE